MSNLKLNNTDKSSNELKENKKEVIVEKKDEETKEVKSETNEITEINENTEIKPEPEKKSKLHSLFDDVNKHIK